ncbi:dihydropteroate synthase [Candidatus Peregrinibacteria bacterium]|nr:dihydropteroate synthase [Candidatus Peregrinibacteria bacterium]
MGILNVTPDSFSDGGQFFDTEKAVKQAQKMVREGADIIDVGGESTGPGSVDVPLAEELRRVIPVIKKLKELNLKAEISIDTYKVQVAREAILAGATIVNDVTAMRGDPEMAAVVSQFGVKVVLMYSKDKIPRTTRELKQYDDVIKTIMYFFEERIAYAQNYGIRRNQMIIDPGMGAFVSGEPKYSFEVLQRLAQFNKLGLPILVGTSRKSFLGGEVDDRLQQTLKASALAAKNGATILRVHDVASHKTLLN